MISHRWAIPLTVAIMLPKVRSSLIAVSIWILRCLSCVMLRDGCADSHCSRCSRTMWKNWQHLLSEPPPQHRDFCVRKTFSVPIFLSVFAAIRHKNHLSAGSFLPTNASCALHWPFRVDRGSVEVRDTRRDLRAHISNLIWDFIKGNYALLCRFINQNIFWRTPLSAVAQVRLVLIIHSVLWTRASFKSI